MNHHATPPTIFYILYAHLTNYYWGGPNHKMYCGVMVDPSPFSTLKCIIFLLSVMRQLFQKHTDPQKCLFIQYTTKC